MIINQWIWTILWKTCLIARFRSFFWCFFSCWVKHLICGNPKTCSSNPLFTTVDIELGWWAADILLLTIYSTPFPRTPCFNWGRRRKQATINPKHWMVCCWVPRIYWPGSWGSDYWVSDERSEKHEAFALHHRRASGCWWVFCWKHGWLDHAEDTVGNYDRTWGMLGRYWSLDVEPHRSLKDFMYNSTILSVQKMVQMCTLQTVEILFAPKFINILDLWNASQRCGEQHDDFQEVRKSGKGTWMCIPLI